MNNQRHCPVCEHTEFSILRHLRIVDNYKHPETRLHSTVDYRRNYILFEYILHRSVSEVEVEFRLCKCCGLIFFSPRPDEADLAIKYKLVVEEGDTLARERVRRLVDLSTLRATKICEWITPYLKITNGRALDIGGSDGHCLAMFTSEFECGILDFEDRQLWPEVRRLGNTLDDLNPDDQFDITLCNHTLEHIPDVRLFVAKVVKHIMDRDGLLYLEVPYGCAGEIYRTNNILTHLNFFSEGSLGFLLEQAGLHVAHMFSGPVLSKQRYLPVIVAIAIKDISRPIAGKYLREGFSITQRQMSRTMNTSVALANARLMLSHPGQYTVTLVKRMVRNRSILSLRKTRC
jgi:hypothetical protein